MAKKFYLHSAIPYVNAAPHIGHAQEFIYSDVIRRYHKLLDEDVLYLCGADENALKIVQAAQKAGMPTQAFCDLHQLEFQELGKKLNIQFDIWQRGTDKIHHFPASQKLWELCLKNGDIYKKSYSGLYCVGCEQFYTKDELDDKGECLEHPGKKLDNVSEENYFFRLSKYQQFLEELIASDTLKITPKIRKNEALAFIRKGLEDFSVSRSKERAKGWGVPVPSDPNQIIYVWFDALNIYQSGIGFGWNDEMYNKWAPADIMVIGKGILRFHAIYWIAILKSAGLKLPQELFVHGYLTVDGQKMSKTVGNVVDPIKLINQYGTDPMRYYLLREIPSYGDGDFSEQRFKKLYNADLANGLGNLVARVLQMIKKYCNGKIPKIDKDPDTHPLRVDDKIHNWKKTWIDVDTFTSSYQFNEALASIWKFIQEADKYVNNKKPWELATKDIHETQWVLYGLVDSLHQIAWQIYPFLPATSKEIARRLNIKALQTNNPNIKESWTNVKPGISVTVDGPLFPRII